MKQLSVFDKFLRTHKAAVLDGGLATELERRGFEIGGQLWSAEFLISHPEEIKRVHTDYLTAGANIITTAGYQASLDGFSFLGVDDGKRILDRSVDIACAARDEYCEKNHSSPRPIVAASAGNYGAFRADGSEYSGRYGVAAREIADVHIRHVDIYARSPADAICFETVPSGYEAEAICRVMERFPEIQFWASFSARGGENIADGTHAKEAVAMVGGLDNCIAAGFNCMSPELIAQLLRSCGKLNNRGFIVYPSFDATNAGKRAIKSGDDALSQFADEWIALGAIAIGGCCGSTPKNIEELEKSLRLI